MQQIENNSNIEILYGILFHPVETYRNVCAEKPYKFPLAIILFAALFLIILSNNALEMGFFSMYSAMAFNIACYWLFFSFFIDLMARMFNIKGKYPKLLTLMAFSFIPWMFLAPLKLLKNFSELTSVIAIILLLGVWMWTIALQMLAISETYEIPRKNAIIILLIPFIGTILYFIWVADFFMKLFQLSGL
ncbi:MAG: YIP1 family protein [bacterium]|nr:YIP1 family protein [bacterium]